MSLPVSSSSPLNFTSNIVEEKQTVKGYQLTGTMIGSDGKSYDVKVVALDKESATKIFNQQSQAAIAIFEAVGRKPIELTLEGDKFKSLQKDGKVKSINLDYLKGKFDSIDKLKVEIGTFAEIEGLIRDGKNEALPAKIKSLLAKFDAKTKTKYKNEINSKTIELSRLLEILKELKAKSFSKLDRRTTANQVFEATINVSAAPAPKSSPTKPSVAVAPSSSKSFVNETEQPLITKIPTNGVKGKCENYSNACWLNSSLKLMACQRNFDALLSAKFPPNKDGDSEALKNLRNIVPHLKMAVNRLRKGETVDFNICQSIFAEIAGANYVHGKDPNKTNVEAQHDSGELIESLLADWANIGSQVDNLEAYAIPIIIGGIETEHRPIAQVIIKDPKVKKIEFNMPSSFREDLTEELIVNVQRTVQMPGKKFKTTRCPAPVALKRNGNNYIATLNNQEFRVKGVLRQDGWTGSGHWVYYEVLENGDVFHHSDTKIQKIDKKKTMQDLAAGTIFYLEKFKVDRNALD